MVAVDRFVHTALAQGEEAAEHGRVADLDATVRNRHDLAEFAHVENAWDGSGGVRMENAPFQGGTCVADEPHAAGPESTRDTGPAGLRGLTGTCQPGSAHRGRPSRAREGGLVAKLTVRYSG